MRSSYIAGGALLASCAWAAPNPRPQNIAFDLAESLPDPVYTTSLSSITYDPTAIIEDAMPQITSMIATQLDASPTDDAGSTDATPTDSFANDKRAATACAPQPSGYGPIPSPDTPSVFASFSSFASAASTAPTPSGYFKTFTNLNASNNAYGYMGYTTLKTYDVTTCANKCNAIKGCMAINIYYERDPSVDPGTGCTNPPSTTNIKCVFWGGPVTKENAVNFGQFRNKFQVVIAGSNGYVNNTINTPAGYAGAMNLQNAAINAPLDEFGFDSYMGVAIFNKGPFDPALCAQACTEKSNYALAHPPTDGSPVQTCQFFNTYILYVNDTTHIQGQYCAMYSESWPSSYATNTGQWNGPDHYLISNSWAYSNASNPGSASPNAAVHQASKDISWATLQPFCSSYLGYTVPVTTVTSVVSTATSVVTPSPGIAKREVMPTPKVLTKYPTAVLSSACSLQATPATSISTAVVSSTTTTTITPAPTPVAAAPKIDCAYGQSLGNFALQADMNSLFAATSGDDVRLVDFIHFQDSAQLFFLDSDCMLNKAGFEYPLKAYLDLADYWPEGSAINFVSPDQAQATGLQPVTCTIDANSNDIACSAGKISTNSYDSNAVWNLFVSEDAGRDRERYPMSITAVKISPCAFGQSLGKFAIQADMNDLFARTNTDDVRLVDFSASQSNAQLFYLDENCVLTKAGGDPVTQAYEDTATYPNGRMVNFVAPRQAQASGLQPVTCTIDADSYNLACAAGQISINAYDSSRRWNLYISEDAARDDERYPMGIKAVKQSPCAFGQSLGAFAIRYNGNYGFDWRNQQIQFIGPSITTYTQLLKIDTDCHLVYTGGRSSDGIMAYQIPKQSQYVYFAQSSAITPYGFVPLTCGVDSSYHLACSGPGGFIFAMDPRLKDLMLYDTLANAQTASVTAPITVEVVPQSSMF